MTNLIEDKIKNKVQNLMKWTKGKKMTLFVNQDKFAEMLEQSMIKIVKTEVNVRLQKIKHAKK